MTNSSSFKRGLYFEEFQVGQNWVSPGRTVTESDIVNFAGLSGDFNQIHVDAEYAKHSPAGQRVAHGILVLSIMSGLALRSGVLEGTVLYFREINEWKFVKPTLIGETIRVEMEVTETKALPRLGGGLVVIAMKGVNQNGETTMKGTWTVLVASKP